MVIGVQTEGGDTEGVSGTITDEIEFSLFQVEYLCRSVRVLDLFKLNPKNHWQTMVA